MAKKGLLPQKIIAYNAYTFGEKLIGITGEVELPELEFMSDTISGAGIGGEVDIPVPGIVGAMEMEVPFTSLTGNMLEIFKKDEVSEITLRGSEQTEDTAAYKLYKVPVKISMRGLVKKIKIGKTAPGTSMESSITLALQYIKIDVDGVNQLEFDPLNMVCVINGEDIMEEVRRQI